MSFIAVFFSLFVGSQASADFTFTCEASSKADCIQQLLKKVDASFCPVTEDNTDCFMSDKTNWNCSVRSSVCSKPFHKEARTPVYICQKGKDHTPVYPGKVEERNTEEPIFCIKRGSKPSGDTPASAIER